MRLEFTIAAATLLAAVTTAQSPTNLIGLTHANSLLVKQDANTATCVARSCATLIPPTPITGQPAGGTATDGRRSAVWISNGTELRLVDANTCRDLCPAPILMPGVFTASIVTGLAYYDPADTLFVVDARSRFYRFQPVAGATGCTLQGGFVCDASGVHPPGDQIAGLAVDDVNGLLYYTSSSFNTALPNNILYVAPIGNPCNPICRIPIRACGNSLLGAIRGAAYDACKRTTWLTDGRQTAGYLVSNSACTVQNVACCPLLLPTNDIYVGLCLRPSESQPFGRSCVGAPCQPCPALRHTTTWAPIGGSVSFDLSGAPAPARALLGIGFGPCQSPGVGLPILCGPIHVFLGPPPAIFAGPFAVNGVGCNGTLGVRVPVPLNPSLCGFVISSQYILACQGGGALGFAVTNCVNTQISSS